MCVKVRGCNSKYYWCYEVFFSTMQGHGMSITSLWRRGGCAIVSVGSAMCSLVVVLWRAEGRIITEETPMRAVFSIIKEDLRKLEVFFPNTSHIICLLSQVVRARRRCGGGVDKDVDILSSSKRRSILQTSTYYILQIKKNGTEIYYLLPTAILIYFHSRRVAGFNRVGPAHHGALTQQAILRSFPPPCLATVQLYN